MRWLSFAIFGLVGLMSCDRSHSKVTLADKTEAQATTQDVDVREGEWVPLFDGKTTNGWHSYGKTSAGIAWQVDDGSLHLNASGRNGWQTNEGGDILTAASFDDFHLKLEWKIAKNGNSGIIFYVQDEPDRYEHTWSTGLEMQVLDNDGHPDAKIHKHRAGDLYDLIASSPENVKPAGEWNQVEIISDKGKLEFHQNGEKVLATTLWDDDWQKLVAGSKFANMPGWGSFKSGKIALQDHGDNVWYRNIKIKRL